MPRCSRPLQPPPKRRRSPPLPRARTEKVDAQPALPIFTPTEVKSTGSVTIGGRRIAYQAVAGTLVVHSKDWDDTWPLEAKADPKAAKDDDDDKPKAEASMFYTAYFRNGAPAANRPVTFLFNGGPGSSTIWLHMGAFGPIRVQTADARHTPAAPYATFNNDQSLLDVSDLVFIDAPGTGFSRIAGKDKEKAFYGVDQDIDAFAQFITQFLSKYGRWNSPKYVFGESYGTMRGAGLALALQNRDVDLNGLILLSNILNWDVMPDDPQVNPGIDMPYIVALPTYAATGLVPQPRRRPAGGAAHFPRRGRSLRDRRLCGRFDQGQRASRCRAPAHRRAARRLHRPQHSLSAQDQLRIEYGAFQKELFGDQALTVGTLDTRFIGATLDP